MGAPIPENPITPKHLDWDGAQAASIIWTRHGKV